MSDKERKKRNHGRIDVVEHDKNGSLRRMSLDPPPSTVNDALRWIREHGEEGNTYGVARFVCTAKVTSTTRTSLETWSLR